MDDWQDVVSNALLLVKQGDVQARAWLAKYLEGKAAGKAQFFLKPDHLMHTNFATIAL